ncbi:MAG: hypothetical protein JWR60_2677 [Polaromonas sp.]|nr:hypothetical protein [Polaromonas sp.]
MQMARLLPTPESSTHVRGLFWRPNEAFIADLAAALEGQKVLEVFAGNGYLASVLTRRGVEVLATSLLSGMDAHSEGLYHPVVECDAVSAVQALGAGYDVLLMSWPTVTEQAFLAACLWGDKPICFIGEVTCYATARLGGCATDRFFECFEPERTFASYHGYDTEKAFIGKMAAPSAHFKQARLAWERSASIKSNFPRLQAD